MLTTLVIAFVVVMAVELVQERVGLNLSDEGYLWNGILRTASGMVPIRDFKSYDPGRFYWGVATTAVLGRGILGVRRSVSVFSALGVWAGLEVARVVSPATWQLVAIAALIVWWMQPRHKRFEIALSLMAVFFVLQILEHPTVGGFFAAGVFAGFAGFMGRNHGLYSVAASGGIALLAWIRLDSDGIVVTGASLGAGVVVGYLPAILLWVFVRGYLRTYWYDKVVVFRDRGTANLKRPIPWPWRTEMRDRLPRRRRAATFWLGVHLVVLPLLYVISLGWAFLADVGPSWSVVAASSIVGLLYMHHAFSRADVAHLCQVSGPYVLAVVGWSALAPTAVVVGVMVVVVVSTVLTTESIVPLVHRFDRSASLEPFDADGDRLLLPPGQVAFLESARRAVDAAAAPGEAVFIGPSYATLYPLFKRWTPVHSDYLLFPESDERQRGVIDDLESAGVRAALISDARLDGRDDLRFSRTHPLVWDYLHASFEVDDRHDLGGDHVVFRRIGAPGGGV